MSSHYKTSLFFRGIKVFLFIPVGSNIKILSKERFGNKNFLTCRGQSLNKY